MVMEIVGSNGASKFIEHAKQKQAIKIKTLFNRVFTQDHLTW